MLQYCCIDGKILKKTLAKIAHYLKHTVTISEPVIPILKHSEIQSKIYAYKKSAYFL